MDVITKYLNRIAYKFPKGYPDMNDSQDRKMLFEMVNSIVEAEEDEEVISSEEETATIVSSPDLPGGSDSYDNTIRYALNNGKDWEGKPIPTPSQKYPYTGGTFTIKVASADKEIFDKLYPVKPPKVGKPIGSAGSLAVGNGEIALYWLYQFSKSATVTEGREGDDPDLKFNGNGVEVKSWSSDVGLHGLGRFGSDKENLSLLSIIFGFKALVSVFDGEKVSKTTNPTNFGGDQLISAMEKLKEFKELLDSNGDLSSEYPLFKNIQDNVDRVYRQLSLSDGDNPKEMASKMAVQLLGPKLKRKPGDGNHVANVKDDGSVKFFQIDFDKLQKSDDLLNDFEVKQSAISINFDKIWG
jgi:hypothetical protein